jgi:hypothetical protein
MHSTSFRLSVLSLVLSAVACNPSGESFMGEGGASGEGGSIPSGGTSGSGGGSSSTPATGGAKATGGAFAMGGITGRGGAILLDGGGAAGGGGHVGTGGQAGSGTGGRTKMGGATAAGGHAGGGKSGTGGASNLGTGGRGKSGTGGDTGAGGDPIDGGTIIDVCTMTTPLTGGKQQCSSQGQGKMPDGYQWTLWSSGGGGCITPYETGCAFKATWNNSGDFLARAGLQWNSTKTYDQLGTITADYAFKKSGSGGSWSYIGIYGWSKSPLVEFYIVEDVFSKFSPGSKVGSITVDGDTYTVYKNYRAGAPSIEGTSNFDQFFSVRDKTRQCGHIDLTQHFAGWAKLGLKLGKMYEAKVLVEASGGNGSVDLTACSMSPIPTN